MTTFNYNPHDFNADLMDGIGSEWYELTHSLTYSDEELANMADYKEDESLPF